MYILKKSNRILRQLVQVYYFSNSIFSLIFFPTFRTKKFILLYILITFRNN